MRGRGPCRYDRSLTSRAHASPAPSAGVRPLDRPIEAGESPSWDQRRQALYFVDMAAPAVLRLDVASGGLDLRTLYVTSLSTDRPGTAEAGTLIRFDVDVAGVPVARFGEATPG